MIILKIWVSGYNFIENMGGGGMITLKIGGGL